MEAIHMDTANYKQTSFGLYVPSHIAEQLQHLDMEGHKDVALNIQKVREDAVVQLRRFGS